MGVLRVSVYTPMVSNFCQIFKTSLRSSCAPETIAINIVRWDITLTTGEVNMPRKARGVMDRWAGEIPYKLAEEANAVRQPHGDWLTKSLLVQFAIQHYVQCVREHGINSVPPFNSTGHHVDAVPTIPAPKSELLQ
jgi:hypothetical protein